MLPTLCEKCGQRRNDGELRVEPFHPHLLNTNNAPKKEEEASLREISRNGNRKLREILTAIQITERNLKLLKEDKKIILDTLDKCRLPLLPIRKVPKDVWREVFLYLAGGDGENCVDSLDVRNGVWPASQVCSSWRRQIRSMTSLWSRITIINPSQSHHAPSVLRTVIQRSQSRNLHIVFKSEQDGDVVQRLLQQLCGHSYRWETIHLFIPPTLCSLLDVQGKLPSLRMLSYSLTSAFNPYNTDKDASFSVAPNLKKVKLGHRGGNVPQYLILPQTVTTMKVTVDGVFYRRIQDIVLPSVTQLNIAADYDSDTLARGRRSLPNVTSLSIPFTQLDSVHCPNLDTLTLYADIREELGEKVNNFVNRSDREFPILTLRPTSIRSGERSTTLFDALTFITCFNLEDRGYKDYADCMYITSRLLRHLIVNYDQHSLPSLSRFTITFEKFTPNDEVLRLIHAVVESRVYPPEGYPGSILEEFEFVDFTSDEMIDLDSRDDLLQRA